MRVLLDTHYLLWIDTGVPLPGDARELLDQAEEVCVSVVSFVEVAIKASLGRLPTRPEPLWVLVEQSQMSLLPIEVAHTARLTDLPHHHRDPFDRLLIAQAQVEGMVLLTADRQLEPYGYPVRRI